MKKLAAALAILGGLSIPVGRAHAQPYPADNSGKNVRDRSTTALTAGQQSNTASDVKITQRIRHAVTSDKALSTNAHNIKIITVHGVVTLRGPVGSAEEKTKIGAKASGVAGVSHVKNDLEIASQ